MTDNQADEQLYSTRYWIARLGAKVDELLASIDINELTSRQRLEFAIKYLGVLQHYQSLEQEQEQQQQVSDQDTRLRLEQIKRMMRTRSEASVTTILDEMDDNQEA